MSSPVLLNNIVDDAQDTYYNCGPSSTYVVLRTFGKNVTEAGLAGELNTTTSGTNSISDVVRVLNAHVGRIYDAIFIPGQSATQEETDAMWARITHSIDSGYGMVVNVVGDAKDTGNNVRSYRGGHYVAVVGYWPEGQQVRIMDVAFGGEYWMTVRTLSIWAAMRGYAYAAYASVPQPVTVSAGMPYPLPQNEWFGDINGGDASHGGDPRWGIPGEQDYVKAIQRRLIELGFVRGVSDPNSGWADGKFEGPTIQAVMDFQAAHLLQRDGAVGPLTWAALFPAPAPTPAPEPVPAPAPEPAPPTEPVPSPVEPVETQTPAPVSIDMDALVSALTEALGPVLVASVKTALKEGIN